MPCGEIKPRVLCGDGPALRHHAAWVQFAFRPTARTVGWDATCSVPKEDSGKAGPACSVLRVDRTKLPAARLRNLLNHYALRRLSFEQCSASARSEPHPLSKCGTQPSARLRELPRPSSYRHSSKGSNEYKAWQ